MKVLGVGLVLLLGYASLFGDMSRQGRAWAVFVLVAVAFLAGRLSKGARAVASAIAQARAEARADAQAQSAASVALYQQFAAPEGPRPVAGVPALPALEVVDRSSDVLEAVSRDEESVLGLTDKASSSGMAEFAGIECEDCREGLKRRKLQGIWSKEDQD